jgi:hypothetical protein
MDGAKDEVMIPSWDMASKELSRIRESLEKDLEAAIQRRERAQRDADSINEVIDRIDPNVPRIAGPEPGRSYR